MESDGDSMLNRLAITKLKAILIIDLIIVAFAFGGYFYVQSTFERPQASAFVLSDLNINPSEPEVGQAVTITANITNIGTESGNYSASLLVDDEVAENKEIQLIVFSLAGEKYVIPIYDVQEIVNKQKITSLPKSPGYLLGVINLRGNVIPIISGKLKLGLTPEAKTDDEKIIIINTPERTGHVFGRS